MMKTLVRLLIIGLLYAVVSILLFLGYLHWIDHQMNTVEFVCVVLTCSAIGTVVSRFVQGFLGWHKPKDTPPPTPPTDTRGSFSRYSTGP